MRFDIKRQGPVLVLQLGLGILYLYSGIDLMLHPSGWLWAIRPLPLSFQNIIHSIGLTQYIVLQGAVEFLFAISFLTLVFARGPLSRKVVLIALPIVALTYYVYLSFAGAGHGQILIGYYLLYVLVSYAVVWITSYYPRLVERVVSLLVSIQMIGILFFVGLTLDTFRDIAILASGLSLFISSFKD